ncbi:MAG: hypothetical protein OHK0031_01080 [Anaerolineales bacterium]
MNAEWWEEPVRFVCNWWWVLLLVLVLGLALYFSRDLWWPLLGF